MKSTLRIFLCSCHGEGISIEKFDDNEIDISLWARGFRPKMDLKTRIRFIWHLLTTGYAWSDEIIVTDETAKRIATALNAVAEKQYDKDKEVE